MKKYKWGIIGLGKIAGKFASDLKFLEHAELYGVASRTLEKAQEFARQHQATRSYGSYTALINDPDVDVIYVATPHGLHFENVMECLGQKKAVLCEKPMSVDSDKVKQMIAKARENKVFLMEALWTAFLPHFQYVQDLIEKNTYGKVIQLNSDFGFKAVFNPDARLYNKSLGGGSLLDIGIYPVFCALTMLGYPKKIEAKAILSSTGVDSEIDATFKYKNGSTASLTSSFLRNTPTETVIHLEKATVKMNGRWHEPLCEVNIHPEGANKEEIRFPSEGLGYFHEAIEVMKCLDKNLLESEKMNWKKSMELSNLIDQIKQEVNLSYQVH